MPDHYETYEEAVARTGRKWPFRTADWPCPACGDPACDLDIDGKVFYSHRHGMTIWRYWHKGDRPLWEQPHA